MIRFTLFLALITALFSNIAFSEIVKKFNIEGNVRVSELTIINFSEV